MMFGRKRPYTTYPLVASAVQAGAGSYEIVARFHGLMDKKANDKGVPDLVQYSRNLYNPRKNHCGQRPLKDEHARILNRAKLIYLTRMEDVDEPTWLIMQAIADDPFLKRWCYNYKHINNHLSEGWLSDQQNGTQIGIDFEPNSFGGMIKRGRAEGGSLTISELELIWGMYKEMEERKIKRYSVAERNKLIDRYKKGQFQ